MARTAAYLSTEDVENALKDADEAVGLEPQSALAVETRACVLKLLGRRDEAIAEYRKALLLAADIRELKEEIERALKELEAKKIACLNRRRRFSLSKSLATMLLCVPLVLGCHWLSLALPNFMRD